MRNDFPISCVGGSGLEDGEKGGVFGPCMVELRSNSCEYTNGLSGLVTLVDCHAPMHSTKRSANFVFGRSTTSCSIVLNRAMSRQLRRVVCPEDVGHFTTPLHNPEGCASTNPLS